MTSPWISDADLTSIRERHEAIEQDELEPEVWGDGCECWVTPEHMWTRYGSAVEPGSQIEYNPECPKHATTAAPDESEKA